MSRYFEGGTLRPPPIDSRLWDLNNLKTELDQVERERMQAIDRRELERDTVRETGLAAVALRRRIGALEQELNRPPEPAVRSVLRWQKRFARSTQVYDYSAIRTSDGQWYTSGPRFRETFPDGVDWAHLWPFVTNGLQGYVECFGPEGLGDSWRWVR